MYKASEEWYPIEGDCRVNVAQGCPQRFRDDLRQYAKKLPSKMISPPEKAHRLLEREFAKAAVHHATGNVEKARQTYKTIIPQAQRLAEVHPKAQETFQNTIIASENLQNVEPQEVQELKNEITDAIDQLVEFVVQEMPDDVYRKRNRNEDEKQLIDAYQEMLNVANQLREETGLSGQNAGITNLRQASRAQK